MPSFHISNFEPKRCTTTPDKCPIGGEHFENMDSARDAAETKLSENLGSIPKTVKSATPKPSTPKDVRELCTVRSIDGIQPIENADAIEAVKVGGWTVVAKKGQFAKGDEVLYVEIDSMLPLDDSRFEFLAPRGTKNVDGRDYHKLKSAKLRGTVSQGIVFARSDFPEIDPSKDIAKQLDIVKWDPPETTGSNIVGGWDGVIQKTDSERAQNLSKWMATQDPKEWSATIKVDGVSSTIRKVNGEHRVFSRNFQVENTDARFTVAQRVGMLDDLEDGHSVQFELAGPGMNGNHHKLKEVRPFVFNVLDERGQSVPKDKWPASVSKFAAPEVSVNVDKFEMDSLMKIADEQRGNVNKDAKDEGIVFKHKGGKRFSELGDRDTFKVVSNKYLLKNED